MFGTIIPMRPIHACRARLIGLEVVPRPDVQTGQPTETAGPSINASGICVQLWCSIFLRATAADFVIAGNMQSIRLVLSPEQRNVKLVTHF